MASSTILFSQNRHPVNKDCDRKILSKIEEFNDELDSFIEDTKPDSSKYSFKYFIYVAHFYSDSNFCFTLGYILNSAEYDFVSPNYVYSFNDETIIIRASGKLAKELGFKKISDVEKSKVIKKLFPSESGGFTYRSKGLTYCNNKGNIEEKLYSNSDAIPFDKSIKKYFPQGGEVKLIERYEIDKK